MVGDGGFAVAHADITRGLEKQAVSEIDRVGKGAQRIILWPRRVTRSR